MTLAATAQGTAAEVFAVIAKIGDGAKVAETQAGGVIGLLASGKKKEALVLATQELYGSVSLGKEKEAFAWSVVAMASLANKKEDAVAQMTKAVDCYRDLGIKVELGQALNGLAVAELSKAKPDAEAALKAAEESWKLLKGAGTSEDQVEAYGTAVKAYMVLGKPAAPVKLAKAELAAAKKAGGAALIATAEKMVIKACMKTGDSDGVMHMAKRACARMAEAGDWKGQVSMLLLASEVHLKGLRSAVSMKCAEEALALIKANKKEGGLEATEAKLRTIVAESYAARGDEPPMTASRAVALKALEDLAAALKEKRSKDFEAALATLNATGGVSAADKFDAFSPVVQKDPSALAMLKGAMPISEIFADPGKQLQVCCLREFPASPKMGVTASGEVKWSQTMGKIVLTYAVESEDTKVGDFSVQASGWQMEVKLSGKKVPALTGDLAGKVLVSRSWWELKQEPIKKRVRGLDVDAFKLTVVISFMKGEHKSWDKLFYESQGMKHPLGKPRYAWTAEMQDEIMLAQSIIGMNLAPIPYGKPPSSVRKSAIENPETNKFVEHGSQFLYAPDDLCVGIDAIQDANYVTVTVHFEGTAMETAKNNVSMEDLFAVDVWNDHISIFIKGDEQNPILWGDLCGQCDPHLTTWRMFTSDVCRNRQTNTSTPAPALEVMLTKSKASQGKWPKVFSAALEHRLMLKNYDELEGMLFMLSQDAEHQTLSDEERDDLYRRLSEWREDRWPGLPDGQVTTRKGNDQQDHDFYANIEKTISEVTKRTGVSGPAKWIPEAGRYSYIY